MSGSRLRLVVAAAPAVGILLLAWAFLEEPIAWPPYVVAGGLALTPLLTRSPGGRFLVAAIAATAGLVAVYAQPPHEAARSAWGALNDAPAIRAPFDPEAYPALHDLVVLSALAFGILVTLGIGTRNPRVVAAGVAGGVCLPAALVGDGHALLVGALALGAVLWSSLALRAAGGARLATGLVVTGCVVAASAGVALAGLVPGTKHVDWRGWDPFARGGRSVSVAYVWDANYRGIEFPTRPTVVLRVRAPRRAEYWRVSTLETFTGDRWIESLYPITLSGPRRRLPADPLVPRRDARPDRWLRQTVTIEGLEDSRIAAASQPARIDGSFGRVLYNDGGVMRSGGVVRRGTEYTVWSYVPRPTPRQLAASPPQYPGPTDRYLELGRTRVPGYGAAGREEAVDALFTDDRYQPLFAYRPLWEEARRRTARARSPYEATLLLERWFRRDGNFRYEEQPPVGNGPPLVDFVERTRAGYCQHYAGAMAVMLRLIGVPARVAVGFTAGTWKGGVWTVTDQQAHAWVEAWFAGYGWLAFDPTPGRGLLSAVYTLASDSADAVAALGTGRFLDFDPGLPDDGGTGARTTPQAPARDSFPWWLVAVTALPVLALGLVVAAKSVGTARRLRRRSPRALAAGVRDELVAQILDRGGEVPRGTTLTELGGIAQAVFRLPVASLTAALADARFGPPERAQTAAGRARQELDRVLVAARERERPTARVRRLVSVRSVRYRLTVR